MEKMEALTLIFGTAVAILGALLAWVIYPVLARTVERIVESLSRG